MDLSHNENKHQIASKTAEFSSALTDSTENLLPKMLLVLHNYRAALRSDIEIPIGMKSTVPTCHGPTRHYFSASIEKLYTGTV